MFDNDLSIDRVVQHHYFSGKDCPMAMRYHNLWKHFLKLVKIEYKILKFKKEGYKIILNGYDKKYINEQGRVNKLQKEKEVFAQYFIEIIGKNGEKKIVKSIIHIPTSNNKN